MCNPIRLLKYKTWFIAFLFLSLLAKVGLFLFDKYSEEIKNSSLFDKYKTPVCDKISLENTIDSFFARMKEDRARDRIKYDCRLGRDCEIWVLPKINIYQLENKIYNYIYREENSELVTMDNGDVVKYFELKVAKFLKGLGAEPMGLFFAKDLKNKSVIYHREGRLFLYNQENFSLKEKTLLIDIKSLNGIREGYRYRLDDEYFKAPNYDVDIKNRDYSLSQCGKVIHIYEFELLEK